MRLFLLFILLITIFSNELSAQLEYSNWYFGNFAGVTFNTSNSNPVYLAGNKLSQFEGIATISDKSGNLLFYTNGEFVVNKFGNYLNIGNPMFGHQSSTQSAIIVPKPDSENLYYIFTADAGEYTGSNNRGINYSILDIRGNSGQGEILEINTPLVKPASEQLSAVYHANGKDIWIIARGWKNNNFYAYLLTKQGISDTVITSIGFTRSTDFHTIGCLKFSPNGNIAATAIYDEEFIELYKFDTKSGEFSNRLQIDIPEQHTLYGVEFSSNGKVLYVSSSKNALGVYSLFQFNLAEYNATKIAQSKFNVISSIGHIGTLQRAINNKIYVAIMEEKYLHSIEYPNVINAGCKYIEKSVKLEDSTSQLGLPQVFKQANNFRAFSICEGSTIEFDTDNFLEDTIKYQYSYKWTGPNSWESNLPKPILSNVQISDTGLYKLNVTFIVNNNPISLTYTINLKIGKHLNFKIKGQNTICMGAKANLSSDTVNPFFSYKWNTGQTNHIISATKPGRYVLYITSPFGCVDSAEFDLKVVSAPKSNIIGDRLICKNETLVLSSEYQDDELTYLWSTGETSPTISVDKPGEYKLIVTNKNSCKDTSSIRIIKNSNIKLKILGDSVLCIPDNLRLEAEITPYDSTLNYEYLWSNGATTKYIDINKANLYKLTVIIDNHCVYIDSINVMHSNKPTIHTNNKNKNELCEGESLVVDIFDKQKDVKYYWEDGINTFPRKLRQEGDYIIIAENKDGCISTYPINLKYLPRPKAEIKIDKNSNLCNRDSLIIRAYPQGENYSYNWFKDGYNDSVIVRKSGKYIVVVTNEFGCSDTAQIDIELGKGLPVKIVGNTLACQGDLVTLSAEVNYNGNNSDLKYLWSRGDTTKTINVEKEGKYSVIVSHILGCQGRDSCEIKFLEIPSVELNIDTNITICDGDSVIVFPNNKNPKWTYFWYDGTNDDEKIIKKEGKYRIIVFNTALCSDTLEFTVNVVEKPNVKIIAEPNNKLCIGQKIILKPSEIRNDYIYEWSFKNSNEQIIEVDKAAWYYLKTTNSNSCYFIDSIQIIPAKEANINIITSKPFLCADDSLFLTAKGDFSSLIWSNGEKNSQIIVKKAGIYSVTAFSEDNCEIKKFVEVKRFSDTNKLEVSDYKFSIICPGQSEQKEIILKNNSENELLILNIQNDNKTNFEVLQNIIGTYIPAKSSIYLPILYKTNQIGDFSSTIKIIYQNYCIDSISFKVFGKSNFGSIIKIPNLNSISGEKLTIPINFEFECIEQVDFVSSAKMSISLDANYFLPESITNGKIIRNEIKNSIRYLEFELYENHFTRKQGELCTIYGTSLLGKDTVAIISIDNFEWSNPLRTTFINGSLSNEYCAIDISQIKYFVTTKMQVSPIPANDFINITVNSQEKGIFVIDLIDYSGIIIDSYSWTRLESDLIKKEIKIEADNLSSGVYSIRLKSPWNMLNSKIIIVK